MSTWLSTGLGLVDLTGGHQRRTEPQLRARCRWGAARAPCGRSRWRRRYSPRFSSSLTALERQAREGGVGLLEAVDARRRRVDARRSCAARRPDRTARPDRAGRSARAASNWWIASGRWLRASSELPSMRRTSALSSTWLLARLEHARGFFGSVALEQQLRQRDVAANVLGALLDRLAVRGSRPRRSARAPRVRWPCQSLTSGALGNCASSAVERCSASCGRCQREQRLHGAEAGVEQRISAAAVGRAIGLGVERGVEARQRVLGTARGASACDPSRAARRR